jgi:hypothetical protein
VQLKLLKKLLENINFGKLNTTIINKSLEKSDHIAIRGEIIMTKDMFNKKYTKKYTKKRKGGNINIRNKHYYTEQFLNKLFGKRIFTRKQKVKI